MLRNLFQHLALSAPDEGGESGTLEAESPAEFEGPLPSILGEGEEDALALLGADEEEPEAEASAEAEEEAEEKTAEEEEPETKTDKAMQQRQQKLANREKAARAAEERIAQATDRLEALAAKLDANPTAANVKAVEEANKESAVARARAKIASIKADPKFDRYTDGDKIDEVWAEALEQIEKGQESLASKTAKSEADREQSLKHETYWNNWAQKNPELGRGQGEELWGKALLIAKSEVAESAKEGVPLTEGQAALSVFRRLVRDAKKNPQPRGKGGKVPEGSGGRLGPAAGRSGGTVGAGRDPLDDIYNDADMRTGKYRLTL